MTIATELPASDPSSAGTSAGTLTGTAAAASDRLDQAPITMLNPDFPFSYDHYLAHPDGLGSVPAELYGTEVAVVGAGLSGLVTAYELMKLGLRPVVYE
ncbi:MAG: amine oxidase, partial [Arthrobacter sp.]|nr:amine oxidase [Arthrobacter sp.]